ncbi:MAG: transporter family protein [Micavibrio sp.]|nr:transporter family protein [Micavibrio sp.]
MLNISNLTYKIGGRTIIENANLNVTDGWRVGVIGLNGAGKSTLFKLITKELQADGGSIQLSQKQKLGQVRQDIPETDTPLIDMVLAANEEMAQLWKDSETETDPDRIGEIFQRLGDMDAYSAPSKAATLLTGLGFKEHQLTEPFSSFSGGWQMRVMLAALLFVEPDFLLLDEPTNHLDLEAIMWLETYLVSYPHTLMIISHDRELLNKCIDHVVHVDKGQLTLYTGNYDTFERERAMRAGLQQKMHEKQQAERAHMQKFIDRFKAKASKAAQAQSRVKAMEKMDLVDAVISARAIRFSFPNPDKIGTPMMSIDKADIGYVEGKPILRGIHENIDPDDRIALLGANGNGKSTLMKLIAGKLDTMKGEVKRAGKLRIGYFSQHQTEELDVTLTPYQAMLALMAKYDPNVREPVVRAKLGSFGFSRDLADNKIGSLSGGEKARLLFAFMSFDSPHLLLLDEPTNHLDIDAREALVNALNAYEGAIVIVSHDPHMLEKVADRLWLVKDGAVGDFNGDLEDYRQFVVQSRREERKSDKQKKDKETAKVEVAPEPKIDKVARKKIEDAEKEIARLTGRKAEIEAQMAQPGFYNDPKKSADVKKLYDRISAELEQKEEAWVLLEAS